MKENARLIRIILPLAFALLAAWYFSGNKENDKNITYKKVEPELIHKEFDRKERYLEYSNHALCRMDCRTISKREVMDIRKNGSVNVEKSSLDAEDCPRWALEGDTEDGQELRIIFAQCAEKMVVVTAIDLHNEYMCACE